MNAPKHELDKRKEKASQVLAKLTHLRGAEGPMKAAAKAKLAEAVDKVFPNLEGVCMASETYSADITIRITVDFTPGRMAVKVAPKVMGPRGRNTQDQTIRPPAPAVERPRANGGAATDCL